MMVMMALVYFEFSFFDFKCFKWVLLASFFIDHCFRDEDEREPWVK